MRHVLLAALLATLPVLAWAPCLLAQTSADAQALFVDGSEHLRASARARSERVRRAELQEALRLFHQSLQITRSRSTVYNVAYCYEELGRYEDAYAYYSEYLAFRDLPDTDRAEARRRLDALAPRVALVEVASMPPGATVYVDRRDLAPRGVTPTTIATRPGSRRIILELEGHEPQETSVDAVLGELHEVRLQLQARPATVRVLTEPAGAQVRFDGEDAPVAGVTPLEATVPAGPHRVYVSLGDRFGREVFDAPPGGTVSVPVTLGAPTSPGVVDIAVDVPRALVSVDGDEVGHAPLRSLRLAPGRHRVAVEGDEMHEPWSDVVEVGPSHRLRLQIHLGSTVPQRRFGPWPTVAMALAGVLAATGAATGGWALALHGDFGDIQEACDRSPQSCGEGSPMRDEALERERRVRPRSIATDVLLSTAGAIAITAFALMLLNREVADPSGMRVGLAPSHSGAMATVGFGPELVSFP